MGVDLSGVCLPTPMPFLREVFSKSRANQLPPHRPYDLKIPLLPGTVPPRCHFYSLSKDEQWAMEDYVAEGLRQGTATGFSVLKRLRSSPMCRLSGTQQDHSEEPSSTPIDQHHPGHPLWCFHFQQVGIKESLQPCSHQRVWRVQDSLHYSHHSLWYC